MTHVRADGIANDGHARPVSGRAAALDRHRLDRLSHRRGPVRDAGDPAVADPAYNVTPAAMGFAVNASTMGMAVAGLVVGLFSRRIDRRLGILVSLALLSVPTALLAMRPISPRSPSCASCRACAWRRPSR